MTNKTPKPFRLALSSWRYREGLNDPDDFYEFLQECDGCAPALCSEDCIVEPDGHCPHGCPSVKLAAGLI